MRECATVRVSACGVVVRTEGVGRGCGHTSRRRRRRRCGYGVGHGVVGRVGRVGSSGVEWGRVCLCEFSSMKVCCLL